MRETGGAVKLVGVQKKVLALMKISRLDQTFKMFDTVAKARKG
jgi:anti-anti-sigma regulatory factor